MAQIKMKLSVRQMRRLLFGCGALSFLLCLAIAAGVASRPADSGVALSEPLELQSESSVKPIDIKTLSLSDFRPVINVKLQGRVEPKSVKKAPKVVPKPTVNIKLHGVFVGRDQDSFGVFEANGKEKVVKLGETISDNGPILTEVAGDYVLVKYDRQPARKIELPVKKP